MPTSGACYGSEKVRYLAQHLSPENYHTVAMLAGVDAPLAALARIEAGSTCQADFELLDKREWLEKRQSRGNRLDKEANQANILLGRQKGRSEVSAGKQEKQVAESQIRLNQQVQSAAKNIEHSPRIVMHDHSIFSGAHQVARLSEITLPFAPAPYDTLDLTVYGGQRIGIRGPNGCGKSTLLRILADQLSPVLGTCDIRGKIAYLDQQLSLLDPQQDVLTQLLKVNTQAGESRLRMQLAQLGLDVTRVSLPCGQLSGGRAT